MLDRAGGNPLFAEEYVRLLHDQDLLERTDGQVRLRPGAALPLPDTVHALIAARLDTLSPDRKALLADASVVGKVFWAGAVAAMADRDEAEVQEALREVARKELIRPVRHSTMGGQVEYVFTHVLTRDVAYDQLPRAVRAARHVAAAGWVEAQAADRVEDVADVLAHHYATASDLAHAAGDDRLAAQVRPAAVRFLILAGERSLGLDPSTALGYFDRAVALTTDGHSGRASALAGYGQAAFQTANATDAQAALEEAAELFRAGGDLPATADALLQLRLVCLNRNDPRWTDLPAQALALLQPLSPGPEHVRALTELAAVEAVLDHHEGGIEHADQALDLADQLGLDVPARALGYRAMARTGLGDLGGLTDFQDAIELATAAGQGREVALLHHNLAVATFQLRGAAPALAAFQAGIGYAAPRGLTEMADAMAASSVDVLVELGRLDEALGRAVQTAAQLQASGDTLALIDLRYTQTRALTLTGHPDQAADWLGWLVTSARDAADPQTLISGLGGAALAYAALDDPDTAVALLTELADAPDTGTSISWSALLPIWLRTLLPLNQIALAQRLADTLARTHPYAHHALATARAALTEAAGDHVTALTAYTDAATRWHDFTMPTEEAFALLAQGRCLLALNRPDEAAPVLQQARDMFAQMGARPALAETELLIASLK